MLTNQMFPSKYLSESDLGGKSVTLIMRAIEVEEVGQQRDRKPVLYFEKAQKGLVLNKVNTRKIESLYGPDTDGWMGHAIEAYPSETDFQGETVACIRVRAPRTNSKIAAPPAKQQQPPAGGYTDREPPPVDDDSIPF